MDKHPPTAPQGLSLLVRRWTWLHLAALLAGYLLIWFVYNPEIDEVIERLVFFPVGVFGAIVANSTGTGGGVVFVPVFAAFRISPEESVAMSFVIQSFGMSVGALIWMNALFAKQSIKEIETLEPHAFGGILLAVASLGIPALLFSQRVLTPLIEPSSLLTSFKVFSIILGVVLLAFTLSKDRFAPKKYRYEPSVLDNFMLLAIGLVGGVVTAFFSVGVGEFLALYLIFRGYPTLSAVAAAVFVSIVFVLAGLPWHLQSGVITNWEALVLAIPGAMIGGFVARLVAALLGAEKLKLFAALWITLSAAYLLVPTFLM